MACCENVSLYIMHRAMPVVNFDFFCVILAVEECSGSTTLKTQKPTFIYIMGRQSTKSLHSALHLVCFIHLQWNESQLQESNPLWCSCRWPHLQNLMLKATENIGKVGKNIFMLKVTIHKDLWIEGNLSTHITRLFGWRDIVRIQAEATLLHEQ